MKYINGMKIMKILMEILFNQNKWKYKKERRKMIKKIQMIMMIFMKKVM